MKTLTIPTKPKDKKIFLRELSKQAKQILKVSGQFSNVNEVLINIYKNETGAKKFMTYKEWQSQDYRVKKGSKGFPVWSRPIKITKRIKKNNDDNEENEENKRIETFYSLCYLFSETQVEKISNK